MRPTRLELSGFAAYREPVAIDFDGADLFALVGPTGVGKSSVLDGMVFALYGSVPRLDRRAVEPVISAGKLEARVRLDFSLGQETYTAVRVVRRQAPGRATTKEARLECGARVLAGDAPGVTAAVEDLLGLGFDQFVKSVVLPQGDFARFLHDTPAGRQDLLVRLLELGIFERMREAANQRANSAAGRAELVASQLVQLAGATDQALAAASARVEALESLLEELEDAQPELGRLADVQGQARRRAEQARNEAAALTALVVPDEVADLAGGAARAEEAVQAAERHADACGQEVVAAEQARVDLPDAGALQRLADAHVERGQLRERIASGSGVLSEARTAEAQAGLALQQADAAAEQAEGGLVTARREHAAAALAATLEPGQPCPVCDQLVTALPDRRHPVAVEAAEQALAAARQRRQEAETAANTAREQRVRYEEALQHLAQRLAEIDAVLRDAPDAAAVAALQERVAQADRRLAEARTAERDARQALREASAAAAQARRGRDEAWGDFDAARDAMAGLEPPPADRGDLWASWQALAAWGAAEAPRRLRAAAEADAAAQAAAADRTRLTEELLGRCTACGVDPGPRRPRDACTDALAAAREELARLRRDRAYADSLRSDLAAHQQQRVVAATLGRHLAANRFERWLLDEALARLAQAASSTLRRLSSEQYSLEVDAQRNFAVVDHRNADERRQARTLSGGETFLASLALALALGEQLAELAVAGAPRLESIFLDEGFGSLDAETLDVVAAAIEELGAGGRTVGIVTHVRDLAERVPVRYEVRRTPGGSRVERVAL